MFEGIPSRVIHASNEFWWTPRWTHDVSNNRMAILPFVDDRPRLGLRLGFRFTITSL
jgi:hypothetical protein